MQRSVWTLGVMPRDDVWGEAADEESLLEPRRQNFRGRTFRPPISMMFVALFLVVASVTVMRICLGGHRHVHIDAIIVKAAASSSQTCEGYDATAGCDWTLEWSCPGQRRGTSGVAGEEDADSLGYKCCCGAELWRQMPTNSSSTSNVRLFCFSLMWTSGDEPDLLKFQVEHGASIFACDFTSVYNGGSDSVDLGKGPNGQVMTKCISDMPLPHEKGTYGAVVDGITQTTSSWLSVPTWLRIWEEVRDEGFYKQADWTVKVDPDAVFLPERLRQHLLPYSSAKPLYIHNQNCFADEFHFSGSLEALSRGAMDTYMDGYPRCKDELPWQGWSEDYYMEYCLDLLQVNHEDDFEVLSDQFGCRFSAPGCTEDNWAAFHPFKDVKTYSECYANAMQAAGAAPATAAPAQPPQQALTAAASAEPPPSAPPPPKPAAAQEASPPPEGLPEGPSPQSAGEQPPPPVAEAAGEDAAVVPEQAVQGFKQPPAAAAEDAGVVPDQAVQAFQQPPEAADGDAAVVPEQAVQGFKQPPAAAGEDAGVVPDQAVQAFQQPPEAAGEDAAVVPEQAVQAFKQPPSAAGEDAGVVLDQAVQAFQQPVVAADEDAAVVPEQAVQGFKQPGLPEDPQGAGGAEAAGEDAAVVPEQAVQGFKQPVVAAGGDAGGVPGQASPPEADPVDPTTLAADAALPG
ncbi:unnamed protein product [Prorocentrum cordatum]|uniref:Nucleotide-diphospho-sugar transferase domain-containing protein n=1 Tax=Prorocentrum cordatum TaxID=2364126 RepID=A0ABN9W3X5_9DINO|nr:unnamed protein product [Polarella glacialis]